MKQNIQNISEQINSIDKLYNLNASSDEFRSWHQTTLEIIEDMFTKNSRHYELFLKIKFKPSILILGALGNDERERKAFLIGLDSTKSFLKKLHAFVIKNQPSSTFESNEKLINPMIYYVFIGILFTGSILDTLINAISFFTFWISFTSTIIILIIYFLSAINILKFNIKDKEGNITKNYNKYIALGILFIFWFPILVQLFKST